MKIYDINIRQMLDNTFSFCFVYSFYFRIQGAIDRIVEERERDWRLRRLVKLNWYPILVESWEFIYNKDKNLVRLKWDNIVEWLCVLPSWFRCQKVTFASAYLYLYPIDFEITVVHSTYPYCTTNRSFYSSGQK